ncbi:AMP-dependent synthetase and ligase, partial [Reticulomyxa filosa]
MWVPFFFLLSHIFLAFFLIIKKNSEKKGIFSFYELIEQASREFVPVQTRADDPAVIIYTSGTTGNPKGCLHGHRVLLGHMPGVEMPQNFFPQKGDVFFTPADFAWIGGLFDALLPSWYNGIPIVTFRPDKFRPDECIHLMKKHNVKNTFMPPTGIN